MWYESETVVYLRSKCLILNDNFVKVNLFVHSAGLVKQASSNIASAKKSLAFFSPSTGIKPNRLEEGMKMNEK